MITIKNTQRKVTVNTKQLRADAQKILDTLGYNDFDLGIFLASSAAIRTHNRTYRGKDTATDILSFSYHPHLKPGQKIKPTSEEDKNLGDLVICPEYVLQDAPRWNMDFVQRMKTLLVHGMCHLLGYDHETDQEYRVMKRKETSLLEKITN